MSKYKNRLKQMKNRWENSQQDYDTTFGGVKIDPGNYIAVLQKAEIVESKSSQKLMIKREHLITEGKWQGQVVYDYLHLETDRGFTFARRWIDMMGYEAPDDPGELEELVESISEDGAKVEIKIKHSGDFVNVGIIALVDEEDSDDDEEGDDDQDTGDDGDEEGDDEEGDDDDGDEEGDDEDEEGDELFENLTAFCEANDVEVTEDDTIEDLKERISEYDWPEDEMTEEEVKLFEEAGLGGTIKRKEKKKKAKAKAKKSETKSKEDTKKTSKKKTSKKAAKTSTKKGAKKKKK